MFGNIISQVLGTAAQTVETRDPVTDSLVRWLGRLQIQVFGPWMQVGRSGIRCSVHYRQQQDAPFVRCSNSAIAACLACGQSTCVEHSFVSATGEVLCRGCAEVAKKAAPQSRQSPPMPRAAEDPAKLRRKYLRRLGLSDGAREIDIQRAYKKLAAKHHPDRYPAVKKKAAEKRFIGLGQAKDWLLADLRKAA